MENVLRKEEKNDMKAQLKELATNEMLEAMFPNLNSYQRSAFLFLLVYTASVVRSFSQMKLIKTRLRNCIGESGLNSLMKIAIESPEKL